MVGIQLVYQLHNWRVTEEPDISHYYVETYIFQKVNNGIELCWVTYLQIKLIR